VRQIVRRLAAMARRVIRPGPEGEIIVHAHLRKSVGILDYTSCQFPLNHAGDNGLGHHPVASLCAVEQAVGADLVDQPGGATGIAINGVESLVGEDRLLSAGVREMGLIDDGDRPQLVHPPENFHLAMELPFRGAAKVFRFTAQLFQPALVKIPRRQFRVGPVEHVILGPIEPRVQPADGGAFARATIARDDGEPWRSAAYSRRLPISWRAGEV
jgi:hypothetical protein